MTATLTAADLRQFGLAGGLPRTRPVYRHLVRALERAITNGTVTPGRRLPAEREFAVALGVSRTTIVSAYRELEARGLVRGYVGRGSTSLPRPIRQERRLPGAAEPPPRLRSDPQAIGAPTRS
jgi:DNA-binding transcriptional MocR family regulator